LVWNLVSDIKGGIQTESVWQQALRRIFGPTWDELTGGWRKLHTEELHNLYSSPNIIRMIKSRRMRWEGYVARMVAKRNACWWESRKKRDH
jgi:hypothetical protein